MLAKSTKTQSCQFDSPFSLPKLSLDWGHLNVSSVAARQMLQHQSNCALPLTEFRFRNRFGLGSDLHLWAIALCNAMEGGEYRVVTALYNWIYWDQEQCRSNTPTAASANPNLALTCYFAQAEMLCPTDHHHAAVSFINGTTLLPKIYRGKGIVTPSCPTIQAALGGSIDAILQAGMEVLFSRVTPMVVTQAQQQLRQVFGSAGAPTNLITVHIRWGDKMDEMDLVPMERYVQAVHAMEMAQRQQDNMNTSSTTTTTATTHIYLATEDPQAVQAFLHLAPAHWKVHVEVYFERYAAHRIDAYNGNPQMTRALKGAPGLTAISSLLVALEGSSFVLTTSSNWSRVMDELRRAVVNPRRPTRLIDLRPHNNDYANNEQGIRTEGVSEELVATILKMTKQNGQEG